MKNLLGVKFFLSSSIMQKIITTCMQFIALGCLATIVEVKLIRSTVLRESPKLPHLRSLFKDESKVFHSTRWKFNSNPKLIPSRNDILKRSRNLETNDVVPPSHIKMPADETPAISKDASSVPNYDEFHLSSEMVGGGGLQLFGVTNSFVNPGALLSSTIENGLQQLSEAANSLRNRTSLVVQPFSTMTNESPAQFFGIANGNSEEEDLPFPQNENPSVTNATLAQFFGIANIYVGGPNQSDYNVCPNCPICPAPPEHAILTITVTACETLSSLGACSEASVAPSGTIFVSYPFGIGKSSERRKFSNYFRRKPKKKNSSTATVGSALIGIVALPPNTKISVTCPNIPAGISVTTQNGPVLPYKPREEVGFIQLLVSGRASPANVAVACVWKSSP